MNLILFFRQKQSEEFVKIQDLVVGSGEHNSGQKSDVKRKRIFDFKKERKKSKCFPDYPPLCYLDEKKSR